MKKIKLLTDNGISLEELELRINKHLKKGWKLRGNLTKNEGQLIATLVIKT